MTIEDNLKQLIISEYGSLRAFALQKKLTYSNVDSILRRGIKNATWTNVKKLCEALQISADELAEEKIVPIGESMQRRSRLNDLDAIIKYAHQNIKQYTDISVDDLPLTTNEIELLLDTMELASELIKRNRRRMMKNDKN